jgi:hypothetical protein
VTRSTNNGRLHFPCILVTTCDIYEITTTCISERPGANRYQAQGVTDSCIWKIHSEGIMTFQKAIIGHSPWDGGTPPVSVLHLSILAFIKVGIDTDIINHDPFKHEVKEERRWSSLYVFLHFHLGDLHPPRSPPTHLPQNGKAQGTTTLKKSNTLLTHCIVIRSRLASFLIRAYANFLMS